MHRRRQPPNLPQPAHLTSRVQVKFAPVASLPEKANVASASVVVAAGDALLMVTAGRRAGR